MKLRIYFFISAVFLVAVIVCACIVDSIKNEPAPVNPRVNGTVADTCNPMPECVDPKPRAPK